MDRLALINTTRTVPISLYEYGDLPEPRMRKILLGYRFRAAISSTDGAPELFFRWVHLNEWREHHDKPCLDNYGSITIVMESCNPSYVLVQFYHPEVYFKIIKPSPRMTPPKLGTKSTSKRRFNRTYVDFLNRTEAAFLDAWLDKLLDANEQYIATYDGEGPKLVPLESERGRNGNYDRVIEGCLLDKKESEPPRKRRRSPESELFSSDSSDDESPLPSPSSPLEQYPVSSQSSIFDPPTDPRIVDLTHE